MGQVIGLAVFVVLLLGCSYAGMWLAAVLIAGDPVRQTAEINWHAAARCPARRRTTARSSPPHCSAPTSRAR